MGPQEDQTDYAEKFRRLLELFPHPERRQAPGPQQRAWRMVEIERKTDGEVSSSYLSALRKGKTRKPGMRMLDLIAQTMGFPFELWLTEPEHWERILKECGADYTVSDGPGAMRGVAGELQNVPLVADLLEQLIASITNRRTGRPFTNQEIAERSGGRLSEADVAAMRAGELEDPTRQQLLALCDVFGVDLSYFSRGAGVPNMSALTREDVEALWHAQGNNSHLLLRKSIALSPEQVGLLLQMADHLLPTQRPRVGQS